MSSFATTAFAVADASPAAPVFADAGHRASTKAPSGFGLGLGLPTDILHTSIAQSKSAPVGLGIYIPDFDFSEHGGVLVSAGSTIDDTTTSALASSSYTSSEGMMGTRIPRRRMPLLPSPTFTDSDYAPMRTPSPSLLQAKFATPPVLFAFAAPNVPELDLIGSDSASDDGSEGSLREVAEASIEFGVLPTTESISSGLNLLCLSDEELMGYIPSGIVDADDDENYPMQAVGLGLSLAELDGPELVLTLHEHGFRDNNTHTLGSCINESLSNSASSTTTATTTNSLSSSAFSSSSTFYNSLFSRDAYTHPSPHLLPHITSRYLVEGWMAHPKPRLAKVRIGFSLEYGAPVVDTTLNVNAETAESISVNPHEEEYTLPTLGFESQEFWENYLDVLYGQD